MALAEFAVLAAPVVAGRSPASRASSSRRRFDWIPAIGAQYHLGVDGISGLLALLTTFITFIAVLGAWTAVEKRAREFFALVLALEAGMLGTFFCLDVLLFYVFWEAMLIPMYLLIGVWGGQRRVYAAVKFFLFTMAGSVLMLVAILSLWFMQKNLTGVPSFDLQAFLVAAAAAGPAALALPGVRVRVRDQGADVPAAHLAARRARRGARPRARSSWRPCCSRWARYGFIRFAMPLFPNALAGLRPVDRGPRDRGHHLRRARLAWCSPTSRSWWRTRRSATWASRCSA